MKKIFLTTAIAALLSVNVFAADGGKKMMVAQTCHKLPYMVSLLTLLMHQMLTGQ